MSGDLFSVLKRSTSDRTSFASTVREVRLRLPEAVVDELKLVAAAEDLSMNALVACFIDAGMVARGRKSLLEVAPNFDAYLTGSRATGATPNDDEDFT